MCENGERLRFPQVTSAEELTRRAGLFLPRCPSPSTPVFGLHLVALPLPSSVVQLRYALGVRRSRHPPHPLHSVYGSGRIADALSIANQKARDWYFDPHEAVGLPVRARSSRHRHARAPALLEKSAGSLGPPRVAHPARRDKDRFLSPQFRCSDPPGINPTNCPHENA